MIKPSTHRPAPRTSTNTRRTLLLFALAALASSIVPLDGSAAWADEAPQSFLIIVHPNTAAQEVTREFVAQAFLKRLTSWPDGETIRPVDLRSDARVRGAFSSSLLKRSVTAMRSYWQQRIFSGRELPPPELDSDDAVVRYVLANVGAIGYVSVGTKVHGAKVLVLR
jgi:ABC-type phosphate transport system substrate-binding protein